MKWPPCIVKSEQLGKNAMQLVTCSLKEENEEELARCQHSLKTPVNDYVLANPMRPGGMTWA